MKWSRREREKQTGNQGEKVRRLYNYTETDGEKERERKCEDKKERVRRRESLNEEQS